MSMATMTTEIVASTLICKRRRAGLGGIGGRPSPARLGVFDQVFDVIADVSAVLAVGRPPAVDPHFFQGVLGKPKPGRGLHGVQKRSFGFSSGVVSGHLRRPCLPPLVKMREREQASSDCGYRGSGESGGDQNRHLASVRPIKRPRRRPGNRRERRRQQDQLGQSLNQLYSTIRLQQYLIV